MPPAATRIRSSDPGGIITVGIDVGGARKGFHAVALKGGQYAANLSTTCVKEVRAWCRETVKARVIAVDAPHCWSSDGRSRPAERALMAQSIWCFSAPTREAAVAHPRNHFGWMLRGEELYRALVRDFPLSTKLPVGRRQCCFETFPHAITWHLRGGNANASQKRQQRRALLKQGDVDVGQLTNIDLVDAALCALAAYHAATGRPCVSFGDGRSGLIIVPARTTSQT